MWQLMSIFEEQYGTGGECLVYFSPGRVNLIGEHTDYNGGHVFPCALTIGTYGIVRKRTDRALRFYSVNYKENGVVDSSLDDLVFHMDAGWTNYPKGVMWAFEKHGFHFLHGFELLVFGDIPSGSGLSSSASLEVLMGMILKELFDLEVSKIQIATIGQYAENYFNGVKCGIMDQFACAMGKRDHAIFLDTNTLEYTYAPVMLEDAAIVLANSKVKHSLADSAYNERRSEAERALRALQEVMDIGSLGELSGEQFEACKHVIENPVCQKRAKHAVYENQRTIRAMQALQAGETEVFGRLMNESHCSLRDDYEVSCKEIDYLTELAWKIPGVLGSRITGGGFGGCTVSIVKQDAVEFFVSELGGKYKDYAGHEAEFYVAAIGDGARRLTEEDIKKENEGYVI